MYVADVCSPLIWQPREMVELLVLINQLMGKFESEIKNLVQEMFPFLVGRIIAILPKEALPDGPGSHTEVNFRDT